MIKPDYDKDKLKLVEIRDTGSGRVFQEYMDKDIVDDMVPFGMEDHEVAQSCNPMTVLDDEGQRIGKKTVCEAPDTRTQDCEFVPILDKATGKVIDTKTICEQIPLPSEEDWQGMWGGPGVSADGLEWWQGAGSS